MKTVIFSLVLVFMVFTAESCSSSRNVHTRKGDAMGQRDSDVVVKRRTERGDKEVTVKRKKNVDDDGVTISRKKTVKDDDGNSMGKRERTIKTDDNGVTIKSDIDKYDRNGDGKVTKRERKRVLKSDDDGTTIKVKKERKNRKDKNDDALIIDTNR